MKKIAILFSIIILAGCTCIGQIPDQTLYIGLDCSATLPDYRDAVIVTDNCEGVIIQQTPAAGFILDVATPVIDVEIKAVDIFGNESSITFNVVAVDTIYPTIEAGPELLAVEMIDVSSAVKSAHNLIGRSIEYSLESLPDSLKNGILHTEWQTAWEDNSVVIFCPKGGVTDSTMSYFATFWGDASYACPCDITEISELVSWRLPVN